jgi:hypothetical protein
MLAVVEGGIRRMSVQEEAGMPTDLSGLWTFAQGDHTLDDRFALQEKHTFPDGKAGPHGTYFKKLWYRIYRRSPNDFYIFDDNGDFQHFVYASPRAFAAFAIKPADFRQSEMPEVWISTNRPFNWDVPKGDKYARQGKKDGVASVLRLMAADKVRPDLNVKWCPAADRNNEIWQEQYIYRDASEGTFYWLPGKPDRLVAGLLFRQFDWAKDVKKGGDKPFHDVFGDTFAGASHLGQLAYLFYGFDLTTKEFGSNTANLWCGFLHPGTDPLPDYGKTNPKQDIQHVLLFEFPRSDSTDYERGIGIGDNPNLPLGLTGKEIRITQKNAHTEEIASTYDTARSWSMTLGGNAGAGKALSLGGSAGFKDQIKSQLKQQSRYTISRNRTVEYIFWIKVPVLKLQSRFVTAIRSRLVELLAGFEPNWENFIATFGTHYVHAITLGSLDCVWVCHSLAGEVAAHEHGSDLKASASAAADKGKGAGGGLDVGFSDQWKQSTGFTIEREDKQSFELGSKKDPVTIFLDLRPISELLNPIFFPYNPLDDSSGKWRMYSPFIWYGLRKSLMRHLEKLGLNEPLERAAGDDMTPRLVKLTSPSANVFIDNRETATRNPYSGWFMQIAWRGPQLQTRPVSPPPPSDRGMFVTGSVRFEQLPPPPPPKPPKEPPKEPPPPPETPIIAQTQSRLFKSERVDGDNYKAGDRIFCLIATKRGQKARVKMIVNLDIMYCDDGYYPGVLARFSREQILEEEVDTIFKNDVNPENMSIYYNMHFNLKWEEVPWG